MCERETEASLGVGGGKLKHQHINAKLTAADECRQLRVRARQNIQHARLGQAPILSGSAIRAKAHVIGKRRIRAIGPACADESLEGSQPLTLLQQRTRQDQRLAGRLPPHHGIAGGDKGSQIDVRRLSSFHGTRRIASAGRKC